MIHQIDLNKTVIIILFCLVAILAQSQDALMTNVYNRPTTSLNGDWKYIVDPYENGYYNYRYEAFDKQEHPWASAFFLNSKPKDKSDLIEYDFDKMDDLRVPGDWNTQKEKLFYYEGTVWYKKSFDFTKSNEDNKQFLYFGGVNYKAEVYLNGRKLGTHIGGFTPFQFEVTNVIRDQDNHLIVKVDNKRLKDGVPTLNTDWWNYGGITRDVKIIETPETYITDYQIHLKSHSPDIIIGHIRLNGKNSAAQKIQIRIPNLKINKTLTTDQSGRCQFEIKAEALDYWSPSSPTLYDTHITTKDDVIVDQIGFRTIQTKGADILLNNKLIFLKGISIHEESPIRGGRANNVEDAEKILGWAKSLGCNYVRLAHYPHNEHMLRVADKMGLMVWEEIPVYWTINWENKETYLNAQNQISEVIDRDINRACVVIWSMANETPTSPSRNEFLKNLARFTKEKDNTRLISAALEQQNYKGDPFTRTISDPFADVVDILSFNQYIGWYDGPIEKCQKIKWHISQDKPVIISEFGAGAKFGLHGNKDERWTEEYQEYLYQETLKMIDEIDQLRGVSPWILVDFLSPRRVLPVIQDNYNRKGLISEKGEKKKAFYVLKDYYDSKHTYSVFDTEYEKLINQLDSLDRNLMTRYLESKDPLVYSVCLFKTIKTNCNFEKEGLLDIAFGSGYIKGDSIDASFGLPFGNYSLNVISLNDSIKLNFTEFHDQMDKVLKFNKDDDFSSRLNIPLSNYSIQHLNKNLDINEMEIWGKLLTKKFIKKNLYRMDQIDDGCYWEIEFLSKINLNSY